MLRPMSLQTIGLRGLERAAENSYPALESSDDAMQAYHADQKRQWTQAASTHWA